MNIERKAEKMNHQNIDVATARQLIRSGEWNHPTTGMALGYVQANLVILPQSWAKEFATFCRLNPQAAPLLDMTAPGNPHPMKVAPDADLRTDVPRYHIYREGRVVEEPTDILSHWREDFVAFLLGCSFSAERALLEQGIPLRHLEQNKNIAMYQTSRLCVSTPRFPLPRQQAWQCSECPLRQDCFPAADHL